MLAVIILGLTIVLNLLLGLLAYVKNPKAATNRSFFLLTIALSLWSLANYLSVHPVIFPQLVLIRLVLFFAAFLNLAVFLSFLAFPSASFPAQGRKQAWTATAVTAGVMALTLTPAVFQSLRLGAGSANPVPGPGIVLFILQTVGLLGASAAIILKRHHRARGQLRRQLQLIILGIIGTFSVIIFTNFFLVVAFNITTFVPFGPSFTLIFSLAFAYAIIRDKLFDIRLAVARAVIYLLSLGFIVLSYGALLLLIASLGVVGQQSIRIQHVEFIILALLSALAYPRIKAFFTKVTNRILYQDAYDPERLFNMLNKVLAANIELDKLLSGSLIVINGSLKIEFAAIAVKPTAADKWRISGSLSKSFDHKLLGVLSQRQELGNSTLVIVTDSLVENTNLEFIRDLHKSDIGAIASLSYQSQNRRRVIGHIILGQKKSGHPYDGQDVGVLEAIANEMVVAIQNSLRFEEIQRFNVTLQDEIAAKTSELRRKNKRLEELDDIKDDFISMASHQLRTPLTSVKGYLSMMIDGDAGTVNTVQDKMLHQAFFSAQRMVFLITDLLNVSRLKTGKFIIDAKPTKLNDLVAEEIEQLQETARAKGLTLQYSAPRDFPELMFDEVKTRQVVMNFIDNAIYYTPAGGHIDVELMDEPDVVELRVTDDGIGVPKSEQHHLFTKFYRAENARKARPDGTGLGLFMAQKVIIAEGGSVIFKSQEGKGSTFGFSFAKDKIRVPAVLPGSDGKTLPAES